MAVLTANSRGSSVTTTGTTWASTTNAYDGTYGTLSGTYATLTGAASGTTSTIKVSGYALASAIPDNAVLNVLTVTVRSYVVTANRWANPTVQAYVGSTPLGSAITGTALTTSTTPTPFSVVLTGVTIANIEDPTFSIQLNLIRSGGSTDNASVDYLDVSVDYGFENWGSLTI